MSIKQIILYKTDMRRFLNIIKNNFEIELRLLNLLHLTPENIIIRLKLILNTCYQNGIGL